MHQRIWVAWLTGVLFIAGCEQSEEVTIHEPGVYQGASDDLMTDAAELEKRITKQMDR